MNSIQIKIIVFTSSRENDDLFLWKRQDTMKAEDTYQVMHNERKEL